MESVLLFLSGFLIATLAFHIWMTRGRWEFYFLEAIDDMPEDEEFIEWLKEEDIEEDSENTVVGDTPHTNEKED